MNFPLVCPFEKELQQAQDFLLKKGISQPSIGVILGSGLGDFAKSIQNTIEIPFEQIPGFAQTSVEGHSGKLIFGEIEGKPLVALQGRVHLYEGHDAAQVVYPIWLLHKIGIKNLFITNAAGGINSQFSRGSLVMISDHINLTGKNPLVGSNNNLHGTRFPDMTQTYSPRLMEIIQDQANKLELNIHKGVYAGVLGPSYETPAEIKMLRNIGADMVGMSTVCESIAANYLNMELAGISCITNLAAGIEGKPLEHSDIKDQAAKVMESFSKLLYNTIQSL